MCLEKTKTQVVYANMCKYLTKKKRGEESSCQPICPAGWDMEINRFSFFLSSEI